MPSPRPIPAAPQAGDDATGRDTGEHCRITCRIDPVRTGRAAPTAQRDGARPDRAARGRLGEQLAADHLLTVHGLEVLALNQRVALDEVRGELDVIARDPRTGLLVICEVKTRSGASRTGGAVASLGPRQQARLRRLTSVLLATGELRGRGVRFDLVAVDLAAARHEDVTLTHLLGAW
jgi:putative endonuclease